ncbi:hypothetical protein BABINDRAFT_163777 [Babjeviella inositovora NRRL Y-12698]|uniref:3'(2'),5'-bisphosphate nucleotidase n=1 Tax=Babjeviella inositovora NRRL Y-12698 TaxID=984486 RepID=A0A1E3QHX9_9ASCO|nr:uncharacterized protein BABINDRAFT_163777 [Babjeviella inositovora NRRL Y-12698]ODQ77044.1 hypothetical protein BABINDRAFT_163777 [Babjeviella inositovora NRRL Y-12698]
MSTIPYSKELEIAQLAVKRASILTKQVSDSLKNGTNTVTKDDKSPVTIGDFGAQAVIIKAIKEAFPNDEVVGEEDSDVLRQDDTLRRKIFELVKDVESQDTQHAPQLGSFKDEAEICDVIDMGNSEGGNKGRIWALDPIDGTKGFIRGDQFAVCLALIVDGKVKLGVIGCPNLPEVLPIPQGQDSIIARGGLFSAIEGVGSYFQDLWAPLKLLLETERIFMKNDLEFKDVKVCEGVEKGHSSHDTQSQIKLKLSIPLDSTINLDSQAKYCTLSKGVAEIYLRLPVSDTYREKIWDHASGQVLITESGGIVSDIYGNPLDFGKGRTLASKGIIAASKNLHSDVIKAVGAVLGERD